MTKNSGKMNKHSLRLTH